MLAQVWACLIIAQVLQAIRMQIALCAGVDVFDVSVPLLLQALPQFDLQGPHGIATCVHQGRRLGLIRPSTRLCIEAPDIPAEQLVPLPKDTVLCRSAKYSQKKPTEPSSSQEIKVHPQRDQLVAILMQREAEINAATKSKPAAPSKIDPLNAQSKTRQGSAREAPTSSAVRPDSSIPRPSWAFLKPLVA